MMCLKEIEFKTSGVISPCLLDKGHKGKCIHEAICINPTCTCGGFESNLSESDLKEYNKLLNDFKDANNQLSKFKVNIRIKYKR